MGPPSLLPFWTFNICVSLPCWFVIFARFVTIVIFVGTHPLVRLNELLFLCLSLAWFVIFVIFVGLLSLLSFKNWLFLSFACSFVIFIIFSLWGRPLSYSVSICYFCFSCLLMLFSLDSLFSLFWLYLWGRLPSSVFKNRYFCCCNLFHLLFVLDLLSSSVFKSCLVKFDIYIFRRVDRGLLALFRTYRLVYIKDSDKFAYSNPSQESSLCFAYLRLKLRHKAVWQKNRKCAI